MNDVERASFDAKMAFINGESDDDESDDDDDERNIPSDVDSDDSESDQSSSDDNTSQRGEFVETSRLRVEPCAQCPLYQSRCQSRKRTDLEKAAAATSIDLKKFCVS